MRYLLGLISVLGLSASAAMSEEGRVAWVDATREGDLIRLEAHAALGGGEGGSYELTATKEGASGRSVVRQAGVVPASDGGPATPLSTSRLSLEPGAQLIVELRVVGASGEVYEDVVSIVGE